MAVINQLKCGGVVKSRKKSGGIIRYQDGGETGIPDKIDFSKMTFDPQERFQFEGLGFQGRWDAVARKGNYKYFPDTYEPYGGGVKQKPGDTYIGTYNKNKYYASPREGTTPNVRKRVMSMLHPGSGVRGRKLNNDFSRKELQGIWDNKDSGRLDEFIKNLYPEKIKSRVPKLQGGGLLDKATEANKALYGESAEFLTGISTELLTEKQGQLRSNYDVREDPTEMLGQLNRMDTGKALLSGAGKGASIGAAFGPVGAGIGAFGGALVSGIGRLLGKEERDKETEKAQAGWRSGWTGIHANYANQAGYKEGGRIKGKGGSKSDSIKMDAKDGSFIVPAENAETGMDIGKTYLGWNDKTMADRKNKGSEIAVSDGELLYTPEEVGMLKYYGINLDELAPNANSENKMGSGGQLGIPDGSGPPGGAPMSGRKQGLSLGMKDGGTKHKKFQTGGKKDNREIDYLLSPESDYIGYEDSLASLDTRKSSKFKGLNKLTAKKCNPDLSIETEGINVLAKKGDSFPTLSEEKKKEESERNVFDYIPELAGTLQMLGGAYGLREAGKKPDLQISHTLKKLSAETRRLANFGYAPAVLNALNTQIEKSRRDMSKAVTTRGGSPQENMEKMKMILSTTLDKKAGVVFQDAKEKARKWADVIRVDTTRAGQEFDVNKIDLADWYKTQDVFANLMSSGIENVIGARQLKAQQDTIREVGSANPSFTLKT